MNDYYLIHYGVKGMKWGVRRRRKNESTIDMVGGRKKMLTSSQKRKLVRAGIAVGTVAAAVYEVHKNPEKIGKAMSQFKGMKMKDISDKAVNRGKNAIKTMLNSAKEGVKEGMRDAPKKAAKTVTTGIILNATKRMMDSTVGKEESARIFQANDNKKIGKFWKVSPDDKDDD